MDQSDRDIALEDHHEDPPTVTVTDLEMKSFISWVGSTLLLLCLTFWAFLPSNPDNDHVWYYLPDRYYILGIPNWFIFSVIVYCGIIYALGML
jgi:hypothetical protein